MSLVLTEKTDINSAVSLCADGSNCCTELPIKEM